MEMDSRFVASRKNIVVGSTLPCIFVIMFFCIQPGQQAMELIFPCKCSSFAKRSTTKISLKHITVVWSWLLRSDVTSIGIGPKRDQARKTHLDKGSHWWFQQTCATCWLHQPIHLYLESCEPPSQKVCSFAKQSKALPLRTPVALMRLLFLNRRFFLVEASLPTRSG